MRSWKEEFGSFYTNACVWDSKREISMGYSDQTTGEEMVIKAISLAKKYNCKIVGKVTFTPESVGGRVSFIVECHSLTYRYFYDGGKVFTLHNSEVKESDLQKYEKLFGTRSCVDETFRKHYWYTDNWTGRIHSFPTLKAARKGAAMEMGMTVTIYTNQPYGRPSVFVEYASASGSTPP